MHDHVYVLVVHCTGVVDEYSGGLSCLLWLFIMCAALGFLTNLVVPHHHHHHNSQRMQMRMRMRMRMQIT